MPPDQLVSSFDSLRPWQGQVSRAFEELSYQLLKSDVPDGTAAIRTGNPDGGVEWYAILPDGTEWGWQAKHVHDFGNLLDAMSASLRAVVKDRPKLVRLAFVISSNLNTGNQGGKTTSQRTKYENKVRAWKRDIRGAKSISFHLIQESDLLDRLSLAEHRGRKWFWFNQASLTPEWFTRHLAQQVDVAGPRYRPDLQVDLPIEADLGALGCDQATVDELDALVRRVIRRARKMHLKPAGPAPLQALHRTAMDARDALLAGLEAFTFQVGTAAKALPPLGPLAAAFLIASRDAEIAEQHLAEELRKAEPRKPSAANTKPTTEAPVEARGYSVRQLVEATSELADWFHSTPGRALCTPLYFLIGPAGSGKTHLFVDATSRAIASGRPAVVLFGPQFNRGTLWTSICDQLGLPSLGGDELLDAMDSAAEASGFVGRRFVLHIDALNETEPGFWSDVLPALRAAVSRRPHVALAVSCRTTFVSIVDRDNERANYVSRAHPGFGGSEVEATQKYFEHYGLAAPRIPLLVPEFSLPLFLRLYCESLHDSGTTDAAVGHEGRIRIFERYLATKLDLVARRYRPSASTEYEVERALATVITVVDALLDDMAARGREVIPIPTAEALAAAVTNGSIDEVTRILGALQSEGVLSREVIYHRDADPEAGFRIAFQAFSDFLILRRRLTEVTEPTKDSELLAWLDQDSAYGVREAGSIAFPELYGIELLDLMSISLHHLENSHDNSWEVDNRARQMYRSFVEMLPYREPASITDRTIQVLNDAMRVVSAVELFNAIFQIAPQPDNPLNGDRLHAYLLRLRMPARDEFFGVAMYREIWNQAGPTATLARWASKGPYPDYDPQVIEFACIPLIWLLGSPNRFMRDWVTKALVQLLRGHLDVARLLLDRFWQVDDPYVVQRVLVIIYGAMMRANLANADHERASQAKALAAAVRKLVFTRPMRPDELMLDAARGTLQLAVQHGLAPKAALRDIKRPYGFPSPGNPLTEKTLEAKYKPDKDTPAEQSFSTVYRSLLGYLSDFGRYVVEHRIDDFSRHRLGQPYPDPQPRPDPTFSKARWDKFLRSLTPEQIDALAQDIQGQTGDVLPTARFSLDLTQEQTSLFLDIYRYPKNRRWRDDNYPADRARRWVFQRTLSLGWTPERFGRIDRDFGYDGGRSEHKAERWGKKYQWMAFHEFIARIADNFHPIRNNYGEPNLTGLFRVPYIRDIDPSLPPIDYRSFADHDSQTAATWGPPPIAISPWPPAPVDFSRYRGDIAMFLADHASESTPDRILLLDDTEDRTWVLLDALIEQNDPSAADGLRGLRQVVAVDSWFCPVDQAEVLQSELARMRASSRFGLIDDHGHSRCCYAGEVGWSPSRCYHKHDRLRDFEFCDRTWQLVNTVESSSWERGGLDCSVNDSVAATMPSTFIQSRVRLTLDQHGPNWVMAGEVLLTNYGRNQEHYHGLLARADWLVEFLRANGLELLVACWHERMNLRDDHRHTDAVEQAWFGARVDADLNVHLADEVRERHNAAE